MAGDWLRTQMGTAIRTDFIATLQIVHAWDFDGRPSNDPEEDSQGPRDFPGYVLVATLKNNERAEIARDPDPQVLQDGLDVIIGRLVEAEATQIKEAPEKPSPDRVPRISRLIPQQRKSPAG
jgi:hypothetical protein